MQRRLRSTRRRMLRWMLRIPRAMDEPWPEYVQRSTRRSEDLATSHGSYDWIILQRTSTQVTFVCFPSRKKRLLNSLAQAASIVQSDGVGAIWEVAMLVVTPAKPTSSSLEATVCGREEWPLEVAAGSVGGRNGQQPGVAATWNQ